MPGVRIRTKPSKHQPTPFQQLIIDTLESRKMTRYELAVACGWAPPHIYRKLSRPTHHTNIERMFAVLGIAVGARRMRIMLECDGDTTKARRAWKQ